MRRVPKFEDVLRLAGVVRCIATESESGDYVVHCQNEDTYARAMMLAANVPGVRVVLHPEKLPTRLEGRLVR